MAEETPVVVLGADAGEVVKERPDGSVTLMFHVAVSASKDTKSEMAKFNWKGFVIEIVKLALAFLAGSSTDIV